MADNLMDDYMEIQTRICYIYALVDPRQPDEIRYVGKTENPEKRIYGHIKESRKRDGYKDRWIRSLRNDGVDPKMVILKIVPWKDWQRHEVEMIFRHRGKYLTNGTAGGVGGKQSELVRAKMSESRKRAAPLMFEKSSMAMKKVWAQPGYRERQRFSHYGKKRSVEALKKQSASLSGRKNSPETIAKRRSSIVLRRGVAVRNIQTGDAFDCLESAGRSVNGAGANIRRSVVYGYKAYGFNWERIQ